MACTSPAALQAQPLQAQPRSGPALQPQPLSGPSLQPLSVMMAFLRKSRGVPGGGAPALPHWREPIASASLSLVGMSFLLFLHYSSTAFRSAGIVLNMGSFAATAVLVFAAPAAPLSQPRNVICGHLISAVIGVALKQSLAETFPGSVPLAGALAVSLSVGAMAALGVTHPPGGATALIAVASVGDVATAGWLYVPCVGLGALLLVLTAVLGNNLLPWRTYPQYW